MEFSIAVTDLFQMISGFKVNPYWYRHFDVYLIFQAGQIHSNGMILVRLIKSLELLFSMIGNVNIHNVIKLVNSLSD